ncbi:penicillin-insensitive murein endopeptidase [Parvicella tangerina]|uniref:Replication initiation protein n=1 Tax=Parvicella tangerina TaxID=2829795 RepID=A0A916JMQ8_9FLAO|nr:penicillin-insensitive murein endopeptidase [Parvicella tangerina]CAG5081378.1 hypothetical protein CRYO30217_01613 [Parvicella tangerina]
MKPIWMLTCSLVFLSCDAQTAQETEHVTKETSEEISRVEQYYLNNKGNDQPSQSKGSVSNGSLENGKLLPFSGTNYQYFDTTSYLMGRGFMNDKVKTTVLSTYQRCEKEISGRHFYLMECANQNGGKIFPHRTHQNGLSVDFMMPLNQNNKPYYDLDKLGGQHYLLAFDYEGRYLDDPSIQIDFEVVAKHLLLLEQQANEVGLKIKKVIIHTELKDELYAGKYGQQLKSSNIYVVKALSPLINALHDDHYHVDFESL